MPLARQAFADTYVGHPQTTSKLEDQLRYLEEAFTQEVYAAEFEEVSPITGQRVGIFLLCEDEATGALLGYAKLMLDATTEELKIRTDEETGKAQRPIRLQRLYVAKEHIGRRGVGSALLKECYVIAAENACDVMWLGTWDLNTLAVNFYRKNGFVKTGHIYFSLGENKHINDLMQKDLA